MCVLLIVFFRGQEIWIGSVIKIADDLIENLKPPLISTELDNIYHLSLSLCDIILLPEHRN